MLAATSVLAATGYLGDSGIVCVLTILAAVITVFAGRTSANSMRAFIVVCHTSPLLSRCDFSTCVPS